MNNQELSRKVPRSPVGLMSRVYKFILPEVRSELENWRREAEQIPDEELRKQALASIDTKNFTARAVRCMPQPICRKSTFSFH